MIERFEHFHSSVSAANKYIIKIKSSVMSEFGLKAANVMCLYFLGKCHEGLTPAELATLCKEDKAGISKSLNLLREKGYAKTEDVSVKKYKIKYFITESGKEVYTKLNIRINEVVEKSGNALSDEERTIFYAALDKIVNNLYLISKEETSNWYEYYRKSILQNFSKSF